MEANNITDSLQKDTSNLRTSEINQNLNGVRAAVTLQGLLEKILNTHKN